MRKIRIMEHISLDGVIQHSADENDFPYSDWTAPYRTPAGRDLILGAFAASRRRTAWTLSFQVAPC